jgi:PPOX class probable F420-dependent enzyme
MTAAEARRRFAAARVARLATVRTIPADHGDHPDGHDGHDGHDDTGGGAPCTPHLVPIVFAVAADTIYSAVDAKPKRTTALRRLANVVANPAVAVLADHYDDGDWDALWWVRADGTGRILAPGDGEAAHAVALLSDRYPQHRDQPPAGPVLAVDVARWSGWTAR